MVIHSGRIQNYDQYGSGPYLKPVHIGSLSPTYDKRLRCDKIQHWWLKIQIFTDGYQYAEDGWKYCDSFLDNRIEVIFWTKYMRKHAGY